MDILHIHKRNAEAIMREYDRLPPELRAAVQEYGNIPWDWYMDVNVYIEQEEEHRRLMQEFMFAEAGV